MGTNTGLSAQKLLFLRCGGAFVGTGIGGGVGQATDAAAVDGEEFGVLGVGQGADGAQRVGLEVVEEVVGVEEAEVVLAADVERVRQVVADVAEAFEVVADNGAQEAVGKEIVAGVLVVLGDVAHDDVVGIARDDAVDEVGPVDVAVEVIALHVGQVEGVAALGAEGVELGNGAVDEGVCAALDVDTAAQGVADLGADDLRAAVGQHEAGPADVVDDAIGHEEQGGRVFARDGGTVAHDAVVAAVYVALRELVVVAVGKEVDAAPAVGCVVVGQVGEHAVGAVAAQDDGPLQRAVGLQGAVDQERDAVVEHKRGALGQRERGAGGHHEGVVDDVGPRRVERAVGGDNLAAQHDDVHARGRQCHLLRGATLQREEQLVLPLTDVVAVLGRQLHLNAHVDAVLAAHLEVLPCPIGQVLPVDVDVEGRFGAQGQLHAADAQALVVAVVHDEGLRGRAAVGDEGVEGYGVLRHRQLGLGAHRPRVVVVTSTHRYQQEEEDPPQPSLVGRAKDALKPSIHIHYHYILPPPYKGGMGRVPKCFPKWQAGGPTPSARWG